MECPICYESILEDEACHTLECNHTFHCSCIIKWLRQNTACPMCRDTGPQLDALTIHQRRLCPAPHIPLPTTICHTSLTPSIKNLAIDVQEVFAVRQPGTSTWSTINQLRLYFQLEDFYLLRCKMTKKVTIKLMLSQPYHRITSEPMTVQKTNHAWKTYVQKKLME